MRREMGIAQGEFESWCDPWDGPIQVVVGMGEKEQMQVCGKERARQGGVEFLPVRFRIGPPKKRVAEATPRSQCAAAAVTGRSSLARLICGAPFSASQGYVVIVATNYHQPTFASFLGYSRPAFRVIPIHPLDASIGKSYYARSLNCLRIHHKHIGTPSEREVEPSSEGAAVLAAKERRQISMFRQVDDVRLPFARHSRSSNPESVSVPLPQRVPQLVSHDSRGRGRRHLIVVRSFSSLGGVDSHDIPSCTHSQETYQSTRCFFVSQPEVLLKLDGFLVDAKSSVHVLV